MQGPAYLAFLFGFASLCLADEVADRAEIEGLIAALNDGSRPAGTLFVGDSSQIAAELARLADLNRMLRSSSVPLSEATQPRLNVRSVRFITSEVALVDATNDQFGSLPPVTRIPVVFVAKKNGEWKLAAVRIPRLPAFAMVAGTR
jgi:hypothetical protein